MGNNSSEPVVEKSQTEQLKERLKLVSKWSQQDTKEYRLKYPDKMDMQNLQDNYLFYTNQMSSKPDGAYIDEILEQWKGDYRKLEQHHGYIQWLFPIRERGMNWHSQELQLHEANKIIQDKKASARFLKAYELMLDFYGLKLKNKETGELERADNWEERLTHLNRSYHNYLRITRILKSLGELGLEHMKLPAVQFFLHEAIYEQTIPNAAKSCVEYWAHTLRNDEERSFIINEVQKFIKSDESSDGSQSLLRVPRQSSSSPEPEPSTSATDNPEKSQGAPTSPPPPPTTEPGTSSAEKDNTNTEDDRTDHTQQTATDESAIKSSSANTQHSTQEEPHVESFVEQGSSTAGKVEEACEALSLESNEVNEEGEKGPSGIDKVDDDVKTDGDKHEDQPSRNDDLKEMAEKEESVNASSTAVVNELKETNDKLSDTDQNVSTDADKSSVTDGSGAVENEKADSEATVNTNQNTPDASPRRVTRSQLKNSNI